MKELEMRLRLRNNRLVKYREALGMGQRQMAEAIGINHSFYNGFETLRVSPVTVGGGWTIGALAIARFHGVSPDVLWPAGVLAVVAPTQTREVDSADLVLPGSAEVPLLPDASLESQEERSLLASVLSELSLREQRVLERRYGLNGNQESMLQEIGDEMDLSRERIRCIESKAICRVRRKLIEARDRDEAIFVADGEEAPRGR